MAPRRTVRALRIAGWIVGSLLALVIGLVALVLGALAVPPLRAYAVREGVAYANQKLDGMRVAVERVDRLDLWGLNVRGIQLFDKRGRELVRVNWVLVRLRPWALVKRTLDLTQVEIDGVRAQLYQDEEESKKEEPEQSSGPSTFTIRAHHLRIRGAELTTPWQDRTLHARIGTLAAGGQYGPKIALALKEANLRVTAGDAGARKGSDEDVLLQLRTKEGAWDAEKGGRMVLEALVAGAPLALEADLPPLAEIEPWPVREAKLRLSGLDRRALASLGIEDGAGLNAPVELALDVHTRDDRLDVEAKLRSGPARIALTGHADRRAYELKLDMAPARLAAIAGSFPDHDVQGHLRARAWPTHLTHETPTQVELSWSDVAFDGGAVPRGIVRAELPLPIIRLTSISLAGFERAFSLHGEYDTQAQRGSAALRFRELSLEQIQALQKQGIAGKLDGALAASYRGDKIDANGSLALRDLAAPGTRLARLDLELAIAGPTRAPQGRFKLDLGGLAADDVQLDRVHAEADATPQKVSGRLEVHGPDTSLQAELGGQRTARGDLRAQAIGRGAVANKELRFDVRELLYGEGGVSVQELSLYSGAQQIRASGGLDRDKRIRAALALTGIDLSEWAAVAKVGGVSGRLDATAKVEGALAAPRFQADVELTRAAYRSDIPLDASLQVQGDLSARRAALQLNLASDSELGARVNATVSLPTRPRALAQAALRARVKAEASVNLPVEQISAIAGDQLAGLGGMLEAKLNAEGTLDAPKVDLDVYARLKLPERSGAPIEGMRLSAKVTKEQGKLDVWAKDELGQLFTADAFIDWPGGSPRAALERATVWRDAHFQARAELQPRRFDTMQGVFAYFTKLYALSLPIRGSAKVTLDGDAGHLDGSARAKVVVFGDKLDGRCQLGAQSAADLEFKLTQDRVEGELSARTDGGGTLRGKVESRLDLDPKPGAPSFGPAQLEVSGERIALYKLPGLCNLAGGSADFHVTAAGLGPNRPTLDLNAKIAGLHAPQQPPLDVVAQARVTESASATVQLKSGAREVGVLNGKVPLTYPDGTTPAVLPDAPISGRIQLRQLPLANVLAFTQALGSAGGSANADLTVRGPLREPYPEGYIELQDANFSIASLAQPLRNVEARVEVKGTSAKIVNLTARDRDGKLKLEGYASLHEDKRADGAVYVEATRFPLRQQGTVVGELSTRAHLDMQMSPDRRIQAQLKILDGAIWVTGERGKKVQELDPNPDVHFADEKVKHSATPAEEKAAQKDTGEAFTLGQLKMKTEQELWLNHKDFSIQVGVDLTLSDGGEGPRLDGQATLHRGSLKLLGKEFRLERGAIRFAGPMPPDPELDIKATYKPPAGQDLVVQVSGRGSAPVLEFSGAASNAGEAVAVLTGVGAANASKSGADNQASAEMAGIAANVTAGLLVMSARRQFGEWVPQLSVETGPSGEPTTASAGFDASKLIPPWARSFARAAYVEGIIGQAGATTGSGVGVGVKLEVAMPRDIITSLGYGPAPGSWSTDVAWSP